MRSPESFQRKPKVPLPVIDRALAELSRNRKQLAACRQGLRTIETRLYRLSGFHRHRQNRAA